ncbi:trehalose-6-phosphate synthase [Streptomyces sp. NPDC002994]|uniref:alpha,alpha-trehalose-phosphate synthase (UDP-forming) n=1 Tax=Streptomyces sp. NPDC002994 TaxID=3154441 RepID=UPI0033ACB303
MVPPAPSAPTGTPITFGTELRAHWDAYRRVNDTFAAACAQAAAPGATVLLQDYHLTLTARRLRKLRPDLRSAHCTMTPWADWPHFAALPDDIQHELVNGLLGADLVCFLVPRWAEAFMSCCEQLGLRTDPAHQAVRGPDGRWSQVRSFPVGVDAASLHSRAASPDVTGHQKQLRALTGDARLVVRVDRMEPSKNIVRGLTAYARFLEQHPEQHGSLVHYVLAYASRSELAAYRDLAAHVDQLTGAINQRFGTNRWQPIVLETRNNFPRALAAMTLADVMVVNPVRDGMNLVAKEAAVLSRHNLALILSQHTGAADDLADGSTLVDPLDIQQLADTIAQSLALPPAERAERLKRLRKGAHALPPHQWLRKILTTLTP